ncbi:glutathione S-transferase family protein [Aliiroseovarius sp. KMU-50]|uniref:Glutathione S-transferase family protein n=1 Tax=Aliiroseovarius salicola TaxID=3009082 RepID=A0ABT4VXD2_9RHOB|nr:glutathione S-transferase family protein [Aliiroseovarius sp. KMU-50]MDA5092907.1 glutathione S-transferase family protein [Aliiroseovarius sp. KMU-50]
MSVTVIGPVPSRTFRVLWALEELGLEYTHHPHMPQSDDVRTHNPAGKVPVLIEDGVTLTDSTAILTYLADKHGRLTYPAGTIERAHQDGFTGFLLDEFDACLWTAARHSFILPEERRVPEVKDTLKWELARSVDELMRRKRPGPFLMGENMTIADIIAGHCGTWAENARFDVQNEEFRTYLKSLTTRDAYKRARQ